MAFSCLRLLHHHDLFRFDMIVGGFLLPCTMASCMNTATYAVHGPLGNKVIPAYHFEGADVGHAFFGKRGAGSMNLG